MIERPVVYSLCRYNPQVTKLCTLNFCHVRVHCISPGRINMMKALLKVDYGLLYCVLL